jgi:hypothetical protein
MAPPVLLLARLDLEAMALSFPPGVALDSGIGSAEADFDPFPSSLSRFLRSVRDEGAV